MDTSEQYIKMCEKAKEIQKQWGRKTGDYAYNHHSTSNFHKGLNYGMPYIVIGQTWDKDTWLPRQDQLQEMVQLPSEFHRICDKLYSFTDWVKEYATYETSDCTMEQLWLAFVMKEKYNKAWNGEEWQ